MASLRILAAGSLLLALGAALVSGQRMLGGPQDASGNSEGVQEALRFALDEYNKVSNDKYAWRAAELQRARIQIVSGLKYILDVKVGRTECAKPARSIESCAFHASPEHKICHFEVHTVPWLSQTSLVKNACQ